MCDQRERLIEYVYGETTAVEGQQIEAHLGDCHVCRSEVAGLRSVRDDLLAWDVPSHEPVWRPFVAPSSKPAQRSWPAWAMTAAAGAVFAAGLAGGIAARGWVPGSDAGGTAQVAAAQPGAVSTVTSQDLAALEAAILERVRTEMIERQPTPAQPRVNAVLSDDMAARVAVIEQRIDDQERWMDDQISLNAAFNGNLGRLNNKTSNFSERLSGLQRVGLETGGQ